MEPTNTNLKKFQQTKQKNLNLWPVRHGIKNLILSNFEPPQKIFLKSQLKKFPSGQLFFHDFLIFLEVCGILEHPPPLVF